MRKRYWIVSLLVLVLTAAFIFFIVYFSSKPAQLAGDHSQNAFYQHKTIPIVVKNEVIAALSYYPELKDTPIDFVFDPHTSKSIMLSQPVVSSCLRGRKHRSYVIKINPRFTTTHSSLPIQDVPKDILIGWFGHELGHIKDYSLRSNWSMIVFGIKYISSDKALMQAERSADTYAVEHGLGDYIVKTKNFILNNTDLPEWYKARIKRLYLSPQQILDMVKKLKKQQDSTVNRVAS